MLSSELLVVAMLASTIAAAPEKHQATGVKVGEVTPESAVIWVRRTAQSVRAEGEVDPKTAESQPADVALIAKLEGSCPGAAGRVRVRYGTHADLTGARTTDWFAVTGQSDFAHSFRLTGLQPGTEYHYASETAPPDGPPDAALTGRFRTAPPPDRPAQVTFTVVTGQMYRDLDDPAGYHIYEALSKLAPDFHVLTGDTVYYDNEVPRATTIALARHHWQRMYSLPRLVEFHRQVPAYWMKDDHDVYYNDCWPSMEVKAMLPLKFPEGQRIFLEQVPMGEKTYRTFRWGRDLQIWLVEGRDFRSRNEAPDGPEKTIWGDEQKRWLTRSLAASEAAWRILISPTPIVGPDRGNKADNHANAAFAHEGNWFRDWARDHGGGQSLFLICGDRHWQYHSVDPRTKVQEFSCGPVSDEHAAGSPGEDPDYHRFHRVKGGFLSVRVFRDRAAPAISFGFHDVHGRPVYTHTVSQRP
ncbi:MAG: hypothetical protein AMXMBFR13_51580 [Phycisphaerae bacterium]